MGEVHNNSTQTCKKKSCVCGLAPFLLGLVVAMLFGWYAYPSIMYTSSEQPIAFNHVAHVENAGMACADCHFIREDGTFSGRPSTESCASCHSTAITEDPEEIRFVEEYVDAGREIQDEWLIYAKQPDNVFFPHAAHSIENCARCHEYVEPVFETEAMLCNTCHIDVASTETPPVYQQNVLSTYSSEIMMMWECEECHALPGHRFGAANASNACFVCHK